MQTWDEFSQFFHWALTADKKDSEKLCRACLDFKVFLSCSTSSFIFIYADTVISFYSLFLWLQFLYLTAPIALPPWTIWAHSLIAPSFLAFVFWALGGGRVRTHVPNTKLLPGFQKSPLYCTEKSLSINADLSFSVVSAGQKSIIHTVPFLWNSISFTASVSLRRFKGKLQKCCTATFHSD